MIDRSLTNSEASVEEREYDAINVILDAAETALLRAASEHQPREVNIERWRWDQPEIVMSWDSRGMTPDLGRNIRVYVRNADPPPYRCSVEANAWLDEPLAGNALVRHWENYVDHTLEISKPQRVTELEARWLKERVERAYERFSDDSDFVLTQAVLILPDGTATHPVEAPLWIAQGMVVKKDDVA